MNNVFSFEKLEVYKKSLRLSIQICRLASSFDYKYQRIRDQLIGAIISIPLNIAEGSGRNYNKEKIQFYKIARASLFECLPILEISYNIDLISVDQKNFIRNELTEISKMISGLIKYLKIPNP